MAAYDDEEYELPLVDQRYFGAGIKRKRVKFVTFSAVECTSLSATPTQSAADAYLSIVFHKRVPVERSATAPANRVDTADEADVPQGELEEDGPVEPTCDICHRRIENGSSAVSHESSIAHQICLKHSHPPSHLDRRRKGLAVMESQGWDPDSRRGLGTEGGGILYPIKAKENINRAGLGLDVRKPVRIVKLPKLDAGKVQAMEKDSKKKAAKLREAFYRSDDLEKYLGADGETNASLDMAAFKRARRPR